MAANILYEHFGRRRNDRVFRERSDPLTEMSDEEVRRRYRFGKDSIRHIVELIRPQIEPSTFRSKAVSAELQVQNSKHTVFLLLLSKFVCFCPVKF